MANTGATRHRAPIPRDDSHRGGESAEPGTVAPISARAHAWDGSDDAKEPHPPPRLLQRGVGVRSLAQSTRAPYTRARIGPLTRDEGPWACPENENYGTRVPAERGQATVDNAGLAMAMLDRLRTHTLYGVNIEFRLRGLPGTVEVAVEHNLDPKTLGLSQVSLGFPTCTAEVRYAGRGYNAAFGWIQVVRSTDGARGPDEFEMDPFTPLGDVPHPFGFFGLCPTLFDAPSRTSRGSMDWVAHSFLSFITRFSAPPQEIRAILGFRWGFSIREARITLDPPAPLSAADWDGHAPLLRRAYRDWQFVEGFREE